MQQQQRTSLSRIVSGDQEYVRYLFFRNEKNYDVVTYPGVLSIRIDESLYFPNARYIEDFINDAVAENPEIKDIFEFTFEDFTLEGYDPHPHIKAAVAI